MAIGLTDLPALIIARTRKIESTVAEMRSKMPRIDTTPMIDLWDQEFMIIVRRDQISRKLLNISILIATRGANVHSQLAN